MRSIMNIKLRFYFAIRRLFLNVKKKLDRKNLPPPSKSKKGLNSQRFEVAKGYPRHPGAAPAEHSGGMAWITAVPGAP